MDDMTPDNEQPEERPVDSTARRRAAVLQHEEARRRHNQVADEYATKLAALSVETVVAEERTRNMAREQALKDENALMKRRSKAIRDVHDAVLAQRDTARAEVIALTAELHRMYALYEPDKLPKPAEDTRPGDGTRTVEERRR